MMHWRRSVHMFTNRMFVRHMVQRFSSDVVKGSNTITSHFVNVNNIKLHYVKAGHGPHILLLMPGGLGSGANHFRHQLADFNAKKFTMIAWDPPGYGFSRPPERVFENYFREDANL